MKEKLYFFGSQILLTGRSKELPIEKYCYFRLVYKGLFLSKCFEQLSFRKTFWV